MTLRVPFDEFVEAVRGVVGTDRVYALDGAGGTSLSAGAAKCGAIVLCHDERPLALVKADLEALGLRVFRGQWSLDGAAETVAIPYVTAVAYRTGGEHPGVWLDAHPEPRLSGASLQALYDEFAANGDLAGATFDEFLAAAAPTVIEVAPETLDGFVRANAAKPF